MRGEPAAADRRRSRSPEGSAPCSLERPVSAFAPIKPAPAAAHLPLHAVDIDGLFHRPKHQPLELAVASKAARIFSLTISSASRRALLHPRISSIISSATTPFASTANIIKELIIRRPLRSCLSRPKSGNGSGLQLDQ